MEMTHQAHSRDTSVRPLSHHQQQASPQNSNRSGQTHPEEGSDEEQYGSGDDDSLHGIDNNANGDAPPTPQEFSRLEKGNDQHNNKDNKNDGQTWLTLRRRCELCKQRKVKCDRGQPSCGWCTRNGASCEYKERKKPGLRAGYGRELEQRLDQLEAILQSHSRILDQGFARNASNSVASEHNVSNDGQVFRHDSHAGMASRAETALFLQKPSTFPTGNQGLEYGSVVSPPTPGLHSIHGSDGFQHAGIPHTTLSQGQYSNQPALSSPSVIVEPSPKESVERGIDKTLPPYDLLYALVDLYFKHINTWCPILHRRSLLDCLFGPRPIEEADRILLRAITTTTMRFSTDPRLNDENRKFYHDINKERVLLYGLENSSIKALQSLVVLALDLVGSSNGPPGWNLLALITRSVVQLGLSVEMSSASVSPNYPSIYTLRAMVLPDPPTWIADESRRRLFWMIYLLDRYATLATAFEFALSESEIDRQLPCRDDLWNKNVAISTRWFRTAERTEYLPDHPDNLGAYSYYIEILGILSRIHQFLKKPVDISALSDVEKWQGEYLKLDSALHEWKFQLPQEYGNMSKLYSSTQSKAINPLWVMLHATYHTAVVRLHSSAAYPTTRSPIFTASYSASQRCHAAVENIAALGEYVLQTSMLDKLGPPFAFTIWVAARLLLVHGCTIEHRVSPQITLFVDILREMGRYWGVAERYSAILTRVLEEQKESEESATAGDGERVTPNSVRILADMRRCAFDLDVLISRQPRLAGPSRQVVQSITPAVRTPAPEELEYLDVFDFFNLPRLPVDTAASGLASETAQVQGTLGGADMSGEGFGVGNNEFNITNFMVDATTDWLHKS